MVKKLILNACIKKSTKKIYFIFCIQTEKYFPLDWVLDASGKNAFWYFSVRMVESRPSTGASSVASSIPSTGQSSVSSSRASTATSRIGKNWMFR